MKTPSIALFVSLISMCLANLSFADLVGNYTADANTLFLLHFDGPAGTSVVTNYGTKGGFFYTVNITSQTASNPAVTTMLGAPSYVSGPTNFNLCQTNGTGSFNMCGYDYNNNGAFNAYGESMKMTNLNIGNGGQTPFTLEAIVSPNNISAGEIICTDNNASGGPARAFLFRMAGSQLQFQFVNGSQSASANIPTTGNDAFVAGNWYHVAMTYDGTTATFYWTLLNGTNGAAHVLGTQTLNLGTTQGATLGGMAIGGSPRASSASETFQGKIDEVRISNVARGSGQMQFYSPAVSITQNPVSQNVDYNQPLAFTAGAASQFPLSFQWRFNSNSIAGATNSTYLIANVAATAAGYYDCVVTNTIGFTNVTTEAYVVVGAANFLANRYSFNTNWVDPGSGLTITPDSISGQNGTNYGNATETGGYLVLDGTTNTYLNLPSNLFNSGNAGALTIEFWATLGVNTANADVFSFGNVGLILGVPTPANCVFYSENTSGGQIASDVNGFAQSVTASGTLDNQTVHVAVIYDAPDQKIAIYTNGVLEAVNTNFTATISGLSDVFSYIGKSLNPAYPYLNGNIDEFRIFRGALSPISILQSQVQGPNVPLAGGPVQVLAQPQSTTVALGSTATFLFSTVGYLPITYQWYKNSSPIAGATNASYSYVPALSDNGANFYCLATNVIGVTTYSTNSTTVSLSVFVPPTLSWLGTADGGADNNWNTTSLDWTNDTLGGGILIYSQTNGVLFDDRSGGGSVDLEQAITPYSMTVNGTSSYTLTSTGNAGSLSGSGWLKLNNTGTFTIDLTNNLSGPVTISAGTLQIGNSDSLGSLGTSVVTNNAALSLNRSDTALNLGNPIHGTGTLAMNGSGAVTISGNSDFSGGTLINSGTIYLTSATGLGSSTATVASGTTLYVTTGINVANPVTLNGGVLQKGGASVTVDTAPVTLSADSTFGIDTGSTLVLSNSVIGAHNLITAGGGTLTLTTNSTITGFTLNGPIVNVGSSGALGTGTVTVGGVGRLVLASGVTVTNAVVANTVSPAAGYGLIMTGDNTNGIVTTASGPITFATAPANGGNFAGPTSSGYLNISGPVSASGLVTLVRYGNVRFSGGGVCNEMQVRANTTSLGADNGIATNAVIDIGGNGSPTVPTYLDLNGYNQTILGLKNTVTSANLGMVTNSSGTLKTLTLNGSGTTYSFSGGVVGKIALVLNSGQQTFTGTLGTNNYTGDTTVNGGTLELANATIATNSTVTIATGATLQLDFATTNQVGALVLGGVTQTPGVYNNSTSPSFLAGSGSLVVLATGPGTFTSPPGISGVTFSGGNVVLAGTGGQAGDAYYLLAGTNLAQPFSLWRTVATNVLGASGSFTFTGTNAVNAGSAQQFYILSNTNYNP
jgi:autotransporter-associated beta strand protein